MTQTQGGPRSQPVGCLRHRMKLTRHPINPIAIASRMHVIRGLWLPVNSGWATRDAARPTEFDN